MKMIEASYNDAKIKANKLNNIKLIRRLLAEPLSDQIKGLIIVRYISITHKTNGKFTLCYFI